MLKRELEALVRKHEAFLEDIGNGKVAGVWSTTLKGQVEQHLGRRLTDDPNQRAVMSAREALDRVLGPREVNQARDAAESTGKM